MYPSNDSKLRSFIAVHPDSHFPIQNLPYGVFRPKAGGPPRVGVAIGDLALDLALLEQKGHLENIFMADDIPIFSRPNLSNFMALEKPGWVDMRSKISRLLSGADPALQDDARLREQAFFKQSEVEMLLPVEILDYTDFYSSKEHATNLGKMFRGPDHPLLPNWSHLPVAYHGRASSVVVSGTDVHRPCGQTKKDDEANPTFGSSRMVDFELEVGFLIGKGNALGLRIPLNQHRQHIFGMVLVNDWSARDIQRWEYQPLGPFLGKNFATSISPWVVTLEALYPFRTTGPVQDPQPLPYLQNSGERTYDIQLEAWLQGQEMSEPYCISRTNYKYLYWDISQQVAHHTVNGCNLRLGDLVASGTISGSDPSSYGSLIELAWQGKEPITFPNGETRTALLDGDRVTLTGWCQGEGYRVGFGEVAGRILPAIAQ